jgi:hypothetical protein
MTSDRHIIDQLRTNLTSHYGTEYDDRVLIARVMRANHLDKWVADCYLYHYPDSDYLRRVQPSDHTRELAVLVYEELTIVICDLYDAINDDGPDPADVGVTNRPVTERTSA